MGGPAADGSGDTFIWDIAIDEGSQGRGIGGSTLDLVIDQARRAGSPRVSLSVFKRNEGALRLYLRKGFVVTTETDTQVAMSFDLHDAAHA